MNEDIKKEILFMLYNYKNIEGLINKRKDELIETIDNGANSWSKSKTQIDGHTMEDIIIKIDDDDKIKRLERWKKLLSDFFLDTYINDDEFIASFIKLKYIDKKKYSYIEEKLSISKQEINYICDKILDILYKIAKDSLLYKEVKNVSM